MEVAHFMNSYAAGLFVSHAHIRGIRVLLGIEDEVSTGGGVVPHGHLALDHQCFALREAGLRRTRFTGGLQRVDVEVDGRGRFGRAELGLPILVEPPPAVGVDDGVQRGQLLSPAREAAQTDAVLVGRIVQLRRKFTHLVPGWLVWHLQTGLLEQVLAVHERGALTIKRRRVQLAVGLETFGDAGEHIAVVIRGVLLKCRSDFVDPVVLGPQWDLVHANRDEVELTSTS